VRTASARGLPAGRRIHVEADDDAARGAPRRARRIVRRTARLSRDCARRCPFGFDGRSEREVGGFRARFAPFRAPFQYRPALRRVPTARHRRGVHDRPHATSRRSDRTGPILPRWVAVRLRSPSDREGGVIEDRSSAAIRNGARKDANARGIRPLRALTHRRSRRGHSRAQSSKAVCNSVRFDAHDEVLPARASSSASTWIRPAGGQAPRAGVPSQNWRSASNRSARTRAGRHRDRRAGLRSGRVLVVPSPTSREWEPSAFWTMEPSPFGPWIGPRARGPPDASRSRASPPRERARAGWCEKLPNGRLRSSQRARRSRALTGARGED